MQDDPFDTLGLAPCFDLSDEQIERAYLARIAAAHPDRETGGQDRAASLNDARRVLLDPERRAAALLARMGGPGAAEDKSLPDGFLMEIMETRAEIEQAMAADPSDETRAQWEAWAGRRRAEYARQVSALFERAAGGERGVLAEIRTLLNAWRYIERLIEQLDPDYDPARADFGP